MPSIGPTFEGYYTVYIIISLFILTRMMLTFKTTFSHTLVIGLVLLTLTQI